MISPAPRIGFASLGCPKALVDSENILSRLKSEGYEIAAQYDDADLVVVNTCGFINEAVEESLDAITEALNQNGKVIVTGCLGARDHGQFIQERYPQVLAVTGPHATAEVMNAIYQHLPRPHEAFADLIPAQGIKLTPRHYAYLKISEGCNHHCTFCIIPDLRGALVSYPIGDVLNDAENLLKAGVRELLVVSQDTVAYGLDIRYRTGFSHGRPLKTRIATLVRELDQLGRAYGAWVRLHYVYPYPAVDELVELMAEAQEHSTSTPGGLIPYLDIPLQHAHPRILKAMQRPAAPEKVLERIQQWRAMLPSLTLRSTFIVGFPGETENEFNELLDFLDAAQLDRVGAFAYSPVDGARANELPNQTDEAIKEERRERFMTKQAQISAQRLQAKIGQTLTVLVDQLAEIEDEDGKRRIIAIARSEADAPDIDGSVHIVDGETLVPGAFARVSVIDASAYDLVAQLSVESKCFDDETSSLTSK